MKGIVKSDDKAVKTRETVKENRGKEMGKGYCEKEHCEGIVKSDSEIR